MRYCNFFILSTKLEWIIAHLLPKFILRKIFDKKRNPGANVNYVIERVVLPNGAVVAFLPIRNGHNDLAIGTSVYFDSIDCCMCNYDSNVEIVEMSEHSPDDWFIREVVLDYKKEFTY